jgi:hypothetical protein
MAGPEQIDISADILEDLELGEIVELEEYGGVSMSAFEDGGTLPFKAIVALAFILRRRDDPSVTFEQALKWKSSALVDIFVPTQAAPLTELRKPKQRGSSTQSKQAS